MVSASLAISANRWSRIHGTAVNCTRWVSSCRHTHSRKSVGSASSSRSTCTMFGATSSSRPSGSWNGSNWPSTLPPRNPSRPPTSAPVTWEPTAGVIPLAASSSVSLSTTGPEQGREPVRVRLHPPGPVDHEHRRGVLGGGQPGELAHQAGRAVRTRAELGDHGRGLVAADRRALAGQPRPDPHGQVPVDHPGAARSALLPRPSWPDRIRRGHDSCGQPFSPSSRDPPGSPPEPGRTATVSE